MASAFSFRLEAATLDISKRKLICCIWTWQVPSRGWICLELASMPRYLTKSCKMYVCTQVFCISLKSTAAWMFLFQDDFVELLFQVYIMYFSLFEQPHPHSAKIDKRVTSFICHVALILLLAESFCCYTSQMMQDFSHQPWCTMMPTPGDGSEIPFPTTVWM